MKRDAFYCRLTLTSCRWGLSPASPGFTVNVPAIMKLLRATGCLFPMSCRSVHPLVYHCRSARVIRTRKPATSRTVDQTSHGTGSDGRQEVERWRRGELRIHSWSGCKYDKWQQNTHLFKDQDTFGWLSSSLIWENINIFMHFDLSSKGQNAL